MLREDILARMAELKLKGMLAAYDEIVSLGLKRRATPEKILHELLLAEGAHREARSIRYRMGQAKFPVSKDLDSFEWSALAQRRVREACRALVIGDPRTLRMASEVLGRRFRPKVVSDVEEVARSRSAVCLLDLHNADPDEIPLGQVSRAAGLAAAAYIRQAVELAEAHKVSGIVTAPINKEALRLADVPYAGHTEMLAALCGAERVAMMLVHENMIVSHVTTHVPLREACDLVKLARVLDVIRLTEEAVRRMGVARPRIAVAGLNPHAGESGLFGEEEEREIAPAVAKARGEGMEVFGPLPPDTVFARQRAGEFDVVVAMTHDQGHIAVKTAGFTARPARTARETARSARVSA